MKPDNKKKHTNTLTLSKVTGSDSLDAGKSYAQQTWTPPRAGWIKLKGLPQNQE